MNNLNFRNIHEEMQAIEQDFFNGNISLSERKLRVEQLQANYETGPNMKNELAWSEWKIANVPMSPSHKHAVEMRISTLKSNA